jgi:hypothetical protein
MRELERGGQGGREGHALFVHSNDRVEGRKGLDLIERSRGVVEVERERTALGKCFEDLREVRPHDHVRTESMGRGEEVRGAVRGRGHQEQ